MKSRREILEQQLKDANWSVEWHRDRMEEFKSLVDALSAALEQPELGNGGEESLEDRKCSHDRE